MSLYSDCLEAGVRVSNHQSDLYIPVNAVTTELLKKHNITTAKTFTNQVEGGLWYDIPFQYIPFWDKKEMSKEEKHLLIFLFFTKMPSNTNVAMLNSFIEKGLISENFQVTEKGREIVKESVV